MLTAFDAVGDETPHQGAHGNLTESLTRLNEINRNLQRELGKARAQTEQLTVERDAAREQLAELRRAVDRGPLEPDAELVERITALERELAQEREKQSRLIAELEQLRAPEPPQDGDASATKDILDAIEQWRGDWASGDVERYLAHYAADFKPGRDEDLDRWRQRRTRTLAGAEDVEIELLDVAVRQRRPQEAKVVFQQLYRSADYRDRVEKQLDLVLDENTWKIRREQVTSIR